MKDLSIVKFDTLDDAWLGIDTLANYDFRRNPLMSRDQFFDENLGAAEVTMFRDPNYIAMTAYYLCGLKLAPFQMVIQHQLWTHAFPMLIASRGASKSFSMALFSLLACTLIPGYKVVIAGASFRQSKMIFEYVEQIWAQSPVLRSMRRRTRQEPASKGNDSWVFTVNDSTITAIPIGNGEKIRGLRANTVICDEMASHNPEIIEVVLFGFGAVASNPTDKMILESKRTRARELGFDIEIEGEDSSIIHMKNKSIITGTADYYFNHFYDYWVRYKRIIESQGDRTKLMEIFGGEIPDAFDWKEFSVMRLPYKLLPKGFMEAEVVARARSQMSKALYEKEYEATFVEDSDGFFKRSAIERCVATEKNVSCRTWVPYCPVPFEAVIEGNPRRQYVFGIDPAAKQDNFAIVVLEVYPDHNRVVYCWVTNEDDFIRRKAAGFTLMDNYYAFCVRKIRNLLEVFPSDVLAIDAQGGGQAIMECLRSKTELLPGEQQIFERIDFKKPKQTDGQRGRHIVYPVQFVNAGWMHDANWGLRGDIEARRLLFPNFDELSIDLCIAQDEMRAKQFRDAHGGTRELVIVDSLADCVDNIEALKDELTNIMYSVTKGGREQWNVPDIKLDRTQTSTGKRDRYSALLMANSFAREVQLRIDDPTYSHTAGGLIRDVQVSEGEPYYSASWYQVNW